MKALLVFVALLLCALPHQGAPVDFARDVLPIFSDNCFHCHGPDEKSRKARLRLDTKEGAFAPRKDDTTIIAPGKSSESELIARIATTNADDRMPPVDSNRTLTPEQIIVLKRWVDEGASWGTHWAFIAPRRPSVPSSAEPAWRRENEIDLFIQARLHRDSLSPAPAADRAMLLRRLTLDLTGLPPTLDEVRDFLADNSPNAYEKVVDRLLASPRFGERMATEWLDLARYADTHGYQMDRFRPMWPYRDWVINAFNRNLPFDRFVTWQVAGDLLPNATKEQRLATAFNRLHNQNEEGGVVEEEYRVAYVVDRVNTFGTAFLGLTTECSRCHDHKFDPISQRDFYSLFAFFQNIDESGQTSYFTDAMPVPTLLLSTDEQDAQTAALLQKISAKEEELAEARTAARVTFKNWLHDASEPKLLAASPVGYFTFDEIISNKVVNLANPTNFAKAQEGPILTAGKDGKAAELNGENGFVFPKLGHFTRSDPFSISLWLRATGHAPRMVVAHHSKAPIDAGSRGYELLLEDGKVAFGLHHMWPRNSLKVASRARVRSNEWVHVAVTYDGSSRAAGVSLFIDGVAAEREVIRDGLFKDITYEGGEPDLTIGFRFRDNGFKGGAVDDFRVYDRALAFVEVSELAGKSASTQPPASHEPLWFDFYIANVYADSLRLRNELRELRRAHANVINSIPEAMVMEEMAAPKPAYILKRGAYDSHGESVRADTPKALPPFPETAPRNRLGLAQWLLDPSHPLMARVTVNRAWQMMFGRGIVETSDNFGTQGAQPTHQDLLDWLACEFVSPTPSNAAAPWDMKRLLKLIALSATYQQSSKAPATVLARDPHNELLARGPASRLSAEMLRDQALALSGLLVNKIGGPSVKPYQPDGLWDIAMGKPRYDTGKGNDLYRRSLYTYWKRTVPPPSMVTFDAADRSYCTARRQNTSTPLQALMLLNDIQLVEAARFIGERMFKEGGGDLEQQLAWLVRTATGREITSRERGILLRLFKEQQEIFEADPKAAEKLLKVGQARNDASLPSISVAAATVLAQAILNHDSVVWKR